LPGVSIETRRSAVKGDGLGQSPSEKQGVRLDVDGAGQSAGVTDLFEEVARFYDESFGSIRFRIGGSEGGRHERFGPGSGVIGGLSDGSLSEGDRFSGILAGGQERQLREHPGSANRCSDLGESFPEIASGPLGISSKSSCLGSRLEQRDQHGPTRLQCMPRISQRPRFVPGIAFHSLGSRSGEGGCGRRPVSRSGEMPGDFCGISLCPEQGLGHGVVEAAPFLASEGVGHRLADQIVGGRPAAVTKAGQPGSGQPVEVVEHGRLVDAPCRRQQARRGLPSEEGEH
jgi:hypothetical protein